MEAEENAVYTGGVLKLELPLPLPEQGPGCASWSR
jgi:hypothetical protein